MHVEHTLLLVDDDPDLRGALREGLETSGYRVVEASDGRSALAKLGETAPEVVLLDVILPEMSGYELCERVRRSPGFDRLPVVMFSARAYPEDRAHALEAGADEFLPKPVLLSTLKACLRVLLSRVRVEAVA